jgi:flagellar motility protein MotE (MotC chaperone)
MLKKLQSPWVAILVGAISYMLTTVLCWKVPHNTQASGEGGGTHRLESGPSWEFRNPEIDQLVAELKKEREMNSLRRMELDELATHLAAERGEIEQLMAKVEAKQREFDANVVKLKEEETANLKKLAKVYAAMTPDGASSILKALDDEQIVRIFVFMKEAESAPILECLAKGGENEAKRAAKVSERIRLSMTRDATKKKST